jgi:hypothetical protein
MKPMMKFVPHPRAGERLTLCRERPLPLHERNDTPIFAAGGMPGTRFRRGLAKQWTTLASLFGRTNASIPTREIPLALSPAAS